MIALLLALALDCSNAKTQMDLNVCSAAASDASVNTESSAFESIYRAHVSTPSSELLTRSETVWKRYRDAQCEFMSAMVAGGSLQPTIESNCAKSLADERAMTLSWFSGHSMRPAPAAASSAAEESRVYGKLRALVSGSERVKLARSESAWIPYRDVVCAQSAMRSCATRLTALREQAIKDSWLADPFW
jgi:uncharacterized protein YecT (DUF1311 family)